MRHYYSARLCENTRLKPRHFDVTDNSGCLDNMALLNSASTDLAGRIMALAPKEAIQDRISTGSSIDTGIWDHPVILLSRTPVDGAVAVLVVSLISISLLATTATNPFARR
jgi:hypothetical protein